MVGEVMNLEDIAKIAIDEVSAELEKIENLTTPRENEIKAQSEILEQVEEIEPKISDKKDEKAEILSMFDELKIDEDFKPGAPSDAAITAQPPQGAVKFGENGEIISSEATFLKNLRERIEVLFAGLNEMPRQRLDERLELTLKFLEFTLANVENRLENLSK
ncbi:GlcNAc transferase [uncultured Campylobacter sp.]|jgi:hypothetical protein|uniref:CiaD-like domain-containing protein n=1 Tax=uncultured Campylobacter sp. TaxID=218934 RepID=UPI0025E7FB10|nr:GlcNAc transferase [uncultured Campylobacter sp.]